MPQQESAARVPYAWQKFDVLQSKNGPQDRPWLDYCTIKDAGDARLAVEHVRTSKNHSGQHIEFRIVRHEMGVGNVAVLEWCDLQSLAQLRAAEKKAAIGPVLDQRGPYVVGQQPAVKRDNFLRAGEQQTINEQGAEHRDVQVALAVWRKARVDLGEGLGGFSLVQLLMDQFPSWTRARAEAIAVACDRAETTARLELAPVRTIPRAVEPLASIFPVKLSDGSMAYNVVLNDSAVVIAAIGEVGARAIRDALNEHGAYSEGVL